MMQHLEDGTQAEMQNLFTFHIYLAYWPETNFTPYFWYTYSLPINLSHEDRCGIFHLWYLLVLKKLNFSKHFEFQMFIIEMLVCSFH